MNLIQTLAAFGLFLMCLLGPNQGFGQKFDTSLFRKKIEKSKEPMETKAQSEKPQKSLQKEIDSKDLKPKKNLKNQETGGVDSGGGNFVRLDSCLVLLDLYIHHGLNTCGAKLATSVLPETKAYHEFGFERLNSESLSLMQKTLAQVQKWLPSSPEISSRLIEALRQLPIYYTRYQVWTESQSYYMPESLHLDSQSLVLGASYVREFGVFIEKAKMDQTSEQNQVALLIHEALRHLQIGFNTRLSQEALQKLTARFMRDPIAGESLDEQSLRRQQELAVQSFEILSSVCERGFLAFCSLVDVHPLTVDFLDSVKEADRNTQSRLQKMSMDQRMSIREDIEQLINVWVLLSNLSIYRATHEIQVAKGAGFELARGANFAYELDRALDSFNSHEGLVSIQRYQSARTLERIRQELLANGFFH